MEIPPGSYAQLGKIKSPVPLLLLSLFPMFYSQRGEYVTPVRGFFFREYCISLYITLQLYLGAWRKLPFEHPVTNICM